MKKKYRLHTTKKFVLCKRYQTQVPIKNQPIPTTREAIDLNWFNKKAQKKSLNN